MAGKYKIGIVVVAACVACWIGVRGHHRPGPRQQSFAPSVGDENGPCINFRQAPSHAGERGCVSGYVLRAYTSKSGNTFLDFCPDYRTCPFSTVIFASDHQKFGNLESLEGREVDVHGFITAYQAHAEIIIHDPEQIQVKP
ncbi:MAG: hypothetical protein ACRD2B_01640 [Terriglobia bacterium]